MRCQSFGTNSVGWSGPRAAPTHTGLADADKHPADGAALVQLTDRGSNVVQREDPNLSGVDRPGIHERYDVAPLMAGVLRIIEPELLLHQLPRRGRAAGARAAEAQCL
jgi:hypothetical protein